MYLAANLAENRGRQVIGGLRQQASPASVASEEVSINMVFLILASYRQTQKCGREYQAAHRRSEQAELALRRRLLFRPRRQKR